MKQYNLNFENAKASLSNFLNNSGQASQRISNLREFWAGGAQRLGVVDDDFPSMVLRSPYFALCPNMRESAFYDTFFGVGGKFLTKEGRKDYDKQAFKFAGRLRARDSKTSPLFNRFGWREALNASKMSQFSASGCAVLPDRDKQRHQTDALNKGSVDNDFIDYPTIKPYPKNYKYNYSLLDGGFDAEIKFDDSGKFDFNLSEDRQASCPSIKPFFDNYDLIAHKETGSYCGFDGGCQVSFYGFWSNWDSMTRFFNLVSKAKEYCERENVDFVSLKLFDNMNTWKLGFKKGNHGRNFGVNCSFPFYISRGGYEIYFNADVEEYTGKTEVKQALNSPDSTPEKLDFTANGRGGEVIFNNCLTKYGQEALIERLGGRDDKRLNEYFAGLAGCSECRGGFVLPCGGKNPAARVSVGVRFGEQVFRQLGVSLPVAGRTVKRLLSSIGFITTDETVGRLDYGFLTDRISPVKMREWNYKKDGKNVDYRFVCHCRPNTQGQDETGLTVTFGRRGGLFNRFYDKDKELERHTSDGGEKRQYIYNMLGDEFVLNMNIENKPFTRVEWELLRDDLQNMRLPDGSVLHVRTLDDVEKCLPAIVKYLVKKWLRITEKNITEGHSSTAKTWKVWEEVGDAAIQWAAWLSDNNNKEVPDLIRETKSFDVLPDRQCAAWRTAGGCGRFLVSKGYTDFNAGLSKSDVVREFGEFGKVYFDDIQRSWYKEGSKLFDRQAVCKVRVKPSPTPYEVNIDDIPDIIYEDNKTSPFDDFERRY